MLRLVLFLLAVAALATGLAWLADRPGSLLINWQGYEIETSVFRAVVMLSLLVGFAILAWSVIRQIWQAPASIGYFFNRRRQRRGLEAISGGIIAVGAGDKSAATRLAVQARRALPNEPLTHLLRAQAAQLSGDRATTRRIFEAMLGAPETELLGLRGLFLEAEREGEIEAAQQFASRALGINPKLAWPADALFELQCKAGDWAGALKTLSVARKNGHVDKKLADRRRAVLLAARAQVAEDNDPNKALGLALEAHNLAPDLVPAAAIAARLLAARGQTPKVAKIVQKTWRVAPHPELATAYAYARLGDSPKDRLARVRALAQLNPNSLESAVALATAAIEAREFDIARSALAPLMPDRMTRRVATAMARIEGEENGDTGRMREWLAKAVTAPRDPAWTADGMVAERWAPVSPVTGALDAFQWRVPVAETDQRNEGELLAAKLEELAQLSAQRSAAGGPSIEAPRPGVRAASPRVSEDAVDAEIEGEAAAASKPASPAATQARKQAAPDMAQQAQAVQPRTQSTAEVDAASGLKEASGSAAAAAVASRMAASAPAADVRTAAPAARPAAKVEATPPAKPKPEAASAAMKSATTAPLAAGASTPRAAAPAAKTGGEPKMYVAPRAPDDPGPDATETEDDDRAPVGYRPAVRSGRA